MKYASGKMNRKIFNHILVAMCMLLLIPFGCRDDENPAPDTALQQNMKINNWILDNMEFWYLWNDKIPGSPDKSKDPETFFKSLLYNNEDRFSWIQDNYQELLNSLQGISKEAGYEFVLYRENESSNNVIAQILYIKPGSPAEAANLKRGDVITHINGQQITTGNYETLLDATHENHTITYKPLVVSEERFDAEKTASLTAVEYAEDPNYLSKVIPAGDRKIGYYVYNFFASGTDGDNTYDTEMESVFAGFKAQGITDLVLDLRFNSGGSETSADNLASLIGKGVDDTKIFTKRSYNATVQSEIINDPDLGSDFLITKFLSKSANIGSQLADGRVYILTSSRTASASELIINALRPFMDVFLIGDVTYGKNVGSISIYDDEDATNTWGLQPIVVKVSNSLDQSDYSSGFTPNVTDKDNSLYLYPLGDEKEALLSQAIGQITGTSTLGRVTPRKELHEIIGSSLDRKKRSFNLVIDRNIPSLTPVH